MTRISRILIERNRITIFRRYFSTVRCKHCGNQLDLMNPSATRVVVIDKLEHVVRFEESILPQTAYSGRRRSGFRGDVDHDSGLKPIRVPG